MQNLPLSARIYVWAVWTSGALLTLMASYQYGPGYRGHAPLLMTFLVLAGLLSAYRVNIVLAPSRESLGAISLGLYVVFTSLFFLDPPAALWVGLVSGIATSIRFPFYQMAFNASLLAVTAYISGHVYHSLAPPGPVALWKTSIEISFNNALALRGLQNLAPIIAIGATMFLYYLLSTFGVATAIALSSGQRIYAVWRKGYFNTFIILNYIGCLYCALMVLLSFEESRFIPIGLLLAFPPILISFIYYRIYSSYLYEQKQYVETLSSLLQATSGLVSLRELDELKASIVQRAVEIMPEVGASVLLLKEEATGKLRPAAQCQIPLSDEMWKESGSLEFLEKGYFAQILRSDEACLFNISGEDLAYSFVPPGQKDMIRSAIERMPSIQNFIGVRLRVSDQVLGCLLFLNFDSKMPLQQHHCSLFQTFANQAATALKNAELYSRLERSYHDLRAAQEQLILTEKMRAIGELASGVAHDFNNILAGILGSAQLARRRLDQPDAVQQRLKIIEQATMDAAAIVRRIQDYSRQQRTKQFSDVDLNEVVRGAIEITRPQWETDAQRRGIKIEVVTDLGSMPSMLGNEAELREVLINLIVNALHAMPEGGRLALRTCLRQKWAVMEVEDTGTGMSEEVQRKAFDPFFTTKGSQGTGMGLSVTYAIISRHQGEISLKSQEGVGTTFTIRLPLLTPVSASVPTETLPLEPGHSILIIEDDDHVRDVIKEMLLTSGQKVTCASDGLEGLERYQEGHYDIVLTDLGMPGMQGTQVIKQIKALSPTTPVILLTGWSGQLAETPEISPDMVLAKPIREQDLTAAITHLLTLRSKDSS